MRKLVKQGIVIKVSRIHIHKAFKVIAQCGKYLMGRFFGIKLYLICNEMQANCLTS